MTLVAHLLLWYAVKVNFKDARSSLSPIDQKSDCRHGIMVIERLLIELVEKRSLRMGEEGRPARLLVECSQDCLDHRPDFLIRNSGHGKIIEEWSQG